MIERTPILDLVTHVFLVLCIALVLLPVYLAFVAATLPVAAVNSAPMPYLPGDQLFTNLAAAWAREDLGRQLFNSMVMASGIAFGKIAISILSAFAITYFNFPFRKTAFALIFASLMLPVEVRIVPTYEVTANALTPFIWLIETLTGGMIDIKLRWNLLNTYEGLILPLIASATATFLFRQFFMTIPDELAEAAKIDSATPMRFFFDILLPLSRTNIAALAVIMFIFGWNQYLWPLLVTTQEDMNTIVIGLNRMMPSMDAIPEWNVVMAGALIALTPPVLVIVVLQRWFLKGLVDSEK
ncbi:MAG: ABC transporter permease subunit [Geminicoccaceae bacterium]